MGGKYIGGTFGEFTFKVDLLYAKEFNKSITMDEIKISFPRKIVSPARNITFQCDTLHLSQKEIKDAKQLRDDYDDYYEFIFYFKNTLKSKNTFNFCIAPDWSEEEVILITKFTKFGWTPKEAWESCLKFTFVNRTESSFHKMWHLCERKYILDDDQNVDVKTTKRYCINFMTNQFFKGGPVFQDRADQEAFDYYKISKYN